MQFYDRLSRDIKTRLDSGEEVECFAARLWENKEEIGLDERSMAFGEVLVHLLRGAYIEIM